jgi:hypothetical protein
VVAPDHAQADDGAVQRRLEVGGGHGGH